MPKSWKITVYPEGSKRTVVYDVHAEHARQAIAIAAKNFRKQYGPSSRQLEFSVKYLGETNKAVKVRASKRSRAYTRSKPKRRK